MLSDGGRRGTGLCGCSPSWRNSLAYLSSLSIVFRDINIPGNLGQLCSGVSVVGKWKLVAMRLDGLVDENRGWVMRGLGVVVRIWRWVIGIIYYPWRGEIGQSGIIGERGLSPWLLFWANGDKILSRGPGYWRVRDNSGVGAVGQVAGEGRWKIWKKDGAEYGKSVVIATDLQYNDYICQLGNLTIREQLKTSVLWKVCVLYVEGPWDADTASATLV